ncbi:MAG: DUF1311 domain-containing protein [Spirochaetales bacterium]|nr:DUF1311 domain-containing protein [Spirochaetales bacterium]
MKRAFFTILLTGLLLPTAPFAGPTPCQGVHKKEALACYKKAYTVEDRRLNALYQRLRKSLTAPMAQELKENSQHWVALKTDSCQRETGAEHFQCQLDWTVSRIGFITEVFERKVPPSLNPVGHFDDGAGGKLDIRSATGGTQFRLEVVRGPTAHLGEAEGLMESTGKNSYTWAESEACGDETCCRLGFQISPDRIQIEEENCTHLYGARAYFAGKYYRRK